MRTPMTRSSGIPASRTIGDQWLRDDEPRRRRGRGELRPDRQVEVVAVLMRREDGGDAAELAGVDGRLDESLLAGRAEQVDEAEVVAAAQGHPSLAERDDADRAGRRMPGRQPFGEGGR